jgi:hypothetical protein
VKAREVRGLREGEKEEKGASLPWCFGVCGFQKKGFRERRESFFLERTNSKVN